MITMKVQIDVEPEIWKQSKSRAALAGVTIKEYVMEALRYYPKLVDEEADLVVKKVAAKKIEPETVAREGSTTFDTIAKSGAYSR